MVPACGSGSGKPVDGDKPQLFRKRLTQFPSPGRNMCYCTPERRYPSPEALLPDVRSGVTRLRKRIT